MSERSTSSALRGPGRGQKPSLPVLSLARVKQAMLDEMKLPDFKGRHFFTARLRIMVFLAAWAMFFVFYPGIWTYSPISPLIFNIGFFVTAVCYWMILNERSILPMIILEAAADVLSQTTMVYVLGIESWAPFFLYGIYVTAAGNLYGYFSSLMAATLVLICYTALVLLINSGIIPPFLYPQDDVGFLNIQSFKPFFNFERTFFIIRPSSIRAGGSRLTKSQECLLGKIQTSKGNLAANGLMAIKPSTSRISLSFDANSCFIKSQNTHLS